MGSGTRKITLPREIIGRQLRDKALKVRREEEEEGEGPRDDRTITTTTRFAKICDIVPDRMGNIKLRNSIRYFQQNLH